MPEVYTSNLNQRIGKARKAFTSGVTTDGRLYPWAKRKADEDALAIDPATRQAYLTAAEWGAKVGHIEPVEFAIVQSALSGAIDPDTGWHLIADLATKVVITKLCNELLQLRGDA